MVAGPGRLPLLPAVRAAVPDSARASAGAGHRRARRERRDVTAIATVPAPGGVLQCDDQRVCIVLLVVQDAHQDANAGRQRRVRPHVPLTCGFVTPLPAPSLCSRPRYPASPVPSGAPCHLVARATPRSAQNRGRIFLCSDPKRLSRFGQHEASCAPRRARIPTQRPVFGLETPPSYQRQAKKPDHVSGVHRCTVL